MNKKIDFKLISLNDYDKIQKYIKAYLNKGLMVKGDMGFLYQYQVNLRYGFYNKCLLVGRIGCLFGKYHATLAFAPISLDNDSKRELDTLYGLVDLGFRSLIFKDDIDYYNLNVNDFNRVAKLDEFVFSYNETTQLNGKKYKNLRSEYNRINRSLGTEYDFVVVDKINNRLKHNLIKINESWGEKKGDKSAISKFNKMVDMLYDNMLPEFKLFVLYRNTDVIAYEIHERLNVNSFCIHTRLRDYNNICNINNVNAFLQTKCMQYYNLNHDALFNLGAAVGITKLYNHKKYLRPKYMNECYDIGQTYIKKEEYEKNINLIDNKKKRNW